ncbi:hypothetical protein KF913_13205 [Candidatus Obscuribacterales bacterium]|nr:hypothetical protein [Candidatus Obscuribacterales bacterium]
MCFRFKQKDGPFTSEDEDWLEGLAALQPVWSGGFQAQGIESFVDQTLMVLAQTIVGDPPPLVTQSA